MFGYVVANLDKLTQEETERYRSCYCGLCNALGKRHGTTSRITINYDMTFLVLFLSSLYKKGYTFSTERCIVHPSKKHNFLRNDITDFAADMNVALTYYNFLDDWKDDKKILSLIEAKLFEKEYKKVAEKHPDQCSAIYRGLEELSAIEKSGELNPDIPANCFGKLMGEITVIQKDEYSERLRRFGNALGRFIYIMDACIDLKSDIKKKCYNPMIATPSENFTAILNLLMADCIEKYRLLPIYQDKNMIENILYSGVWTKYEAKKRKKRPGKAK
ncbi:DUF5685 family protein [Sediminispirochaeta smaragdinae]|uniref:Uncharacterized protein n=1 Tax=Sediminispirochaeta smaragdinae (strain DSM 11293 / JCM 15392 / SEBR 4228) TaxID=573413 RepID=E1R343_SEDSS|nr:DUF5685 family protein [Sediminispirochaeta smaragdinae]ADK81229.1 conserved hypothetical protein [Sediminispirochaeta smaragdinae DSM 11293]